MFDLTSSKVPQIPKTTNPADMTYSGVFDKANVITQRFKELKNENAPKQHDSALDKNIEKMFSFIEEKTMSVGRDKLTSIVTESIERSVYGMFSKNYKLFTEIQANLEQVTRI